MTESEHKTVRLTTCVSEREAEYIKATAADNNVSVSELIRGIMTGFE